jgi:hypothetical protein
VRRVPSTLAVEDSVVGKDVYASVTVPSVSQVTTHV